MLEKPQGSVNLEAGCLAAPSPKTRLTKVQTGITEDYCYKKTKILVLLSPVFQETYISGRWYGRRKSDPREEPRSPPVGRG